MGSREWKCKPRVENQAVRSRKDKETGRMTRLAESRGWRVM
jgi:hypothetical protein